MGAPSSSPLPSLQRTVRFLLACVVLALAGCQSLLPDGRVESGLSWNSFDDASEAIEGIVPFQTMKAELHEAGLDPRQNPAITILSYPDILQRFATGSAVRADDLDPGIRKCLTAGKACSGYLIQVRKVRRERIGNFWLDSLAFRREVDITGWSFNALLLMVDELVVYTVHGGQPGIKDRELVRNPLGPLQAWGEQVPSLLR
jgi:hypothetical protein